MTNYVSTLFRGTVARLDPVLWPAKFDFLINNPSMQSVTISLVVNALYLSYLWSAKYIPHIVHCACSLGILNTTSF